MELIELHILQSFPVTCLNRDDLGAPKSAWFGGVQRARVSSQSWKRPIRAMAKELQPALFAGTRTRFVIRDLKQRFQEAFCEPEAKELAGRTADALGKLDDVEKGKVKTLLYFSPAEIDNVVSAVAADEATASSARDAAQASKQIEEAMGDSDVLKKRKETYKRACDKLNKVCEKAAKRLKDAVKDAADIALFGRMVADEHSLTVEGAGLFSHALSTHRATNEVEFFSAVDDNQGADDPGAAHVGTLEFNSACYYRYVGVNLDLLRGEDHLGHFTADELRNVLDSFVRSSLLAVPGARKNSMFGFNPPAFALGLRRKGQPLSLVNAFERPVKPSAEGYLAPSIRCLNNHHSALKEAYKCAYIPEDSIEVILPDVNCDDFVASLVDAHLVARS